MSSTAVDTQRARQLLGAPELAWLVERLRRRIESGRELRGRVALKDPSLGQRRAIDALLGRSPSGARSLGLQLEVLEELLRRAEIAPDLRSAVEALTGPLDNRRAAREQRERRWRQLLDRATAEEPRPEVKAWLAERRTRTLLRRFAERDPERGEALLDRAREVIGQLPSSDLRPLAELAAATCGDSHALDKGRPLAALVISAAARLGGREAWRDARSRREVWDSVGIVADELSASVLVHALPASGSGLVDRMLSHHAEAAEPCRLTTGQLLRHPPCFAPGLVVHICENPAVVAAAARRLGNRCAPLICGDGRPTVAVHQLLTRLAEAGANLRYHGDFDWPGLDIARQLMEHHPISPWRLGTADYLAAPAGPTLRGQPTSAPWDPDLVHAMVRRGRMVEEEHVLDDLLVDLSR